MAVWLKKFHQHQVSEETTKIWSSRGPEVMNRRHAFFLLPGLSVNTKFCSAIEHWVSAKLKESSQPHLIEFISITSKESLFKNITDLQAHMLFYFFSSTLSALSFNSKEEKTYTWVLKESDLLQTSKQNQITVVLQNQICDC